MKALVLNGMKKSHPINEDLKKILEKRGWDVINIILRKKMIAPCQGCFDCWIKTPGICKIDDFGREVTKMTINSNLVIHLTPISFGGYSSELKKAIDRSIPVLLPFFKYIDGEIHHKFRYEIRPSIIVIGVSKQPNQDQGRIFKELVRRNSLNMGAPLHKSLILSEKYHVRLINEFNSLVEEVESLL